MIFAFTEPLLNEAVGGERLAKARSALAPYGTVSTMRAVGRHGAETVLVLKDAERVSEIPLGQLGLVKTDVA